MKIMYKLIAILLVLSIIPLAILGYVAVSKTESVGVEVNGMLDTTLQQQAKDSMANQVELLTSHVEAQLQTYMNDIKSISKHPDVSEMMRTARDTGILENTDDIKRHYPSPITSSWQNVQDYFMNVYNERINDIDMIRIFYEDGYVVNGVVLGAEDIRDFKGDKSWFADTMDPGVTGPNEYYVSPISIARRTDSPAIRYMTPITIDGEREGLIIINFKSSAITDEIQNFKYGKEGYGMFVDANYENAEGTISPFPVVISKPTEDGSLYYINQDVQAPISSESLSRDSGFVEFEENGKKWISAYQKVDWEGKSWYVLINVPEEEIVAIAKQTQDSLNNLVDETKSSLSTILLIAIILTVLIGYVFANSITNPIRNLVTAGNKIADGNIETDIPEVKTNDEIQELGMTMTMLAGALKFLKKEKSGKKK